VKEQIKNLLGLLAAVLAIVLIIFLGVEISNRVRGSYDLSKTRSINMSADGKVTAKPDIATLNFSVVTQGRDSTRVQTDNDAKMTDVMNYLKSNGVAEDDTETSGYSLYPQYDYSNNSQGTITGYNLTQNVTIKVRKLETVPTILGGLTAKGINQIGNVSYTIEDPDKLKVEARDQAIDKAKQKAQELADRIGVKLGKVINFTEGSGYFPPMFYDRQSSPPLPGVPNSSPVQPGTEDVVVNVTLTFELR